MEIGAIAYIHTDLPEKFGLPRQSGVVKELTGYVEFVPPYGNAEAVRGIEGYDYLWLLWGFDVKESSGFKATVRPPRLGGNTRMGVFATRSPFRPNRLGLSSVRLERVEMTETGPKLHVSGIDMKDGTPIYDIKPYLAYTDSHPDARSGFSDEVNFDELKIDFTKELLDPVPEDKREALLQLLRQDPRPSYIEEEGRIYGLSFGGFNIRFTVEGGTLRVTAVEEISKDEMK